VDELGAGVLARGQLPEMFRFDRFCFYCVRRSLPRSDGHLAVLPLSPTDALIKLNARCSLALLIPLRGWLNALTGLRIGTIPQRRPLW